MAVILSAHASNGGPTVARPEPLSTRRMLKVLGKRLEKASVIKLTKKYEGVRKVHRLRVATRKAMAALAVCKPLLGKSVAKRIEKILKLQRKSLGKVRDWDVLISRVLCVPADDKAETRCDLLLYLSEERTDAWKAAKTSWKRAMRGGTDCLDLKRASGHGDQTAHELMREAIGATRLTIEKQISGGREEIPSDIRSLHQLRIACKQLRYLYEFFDEVTHAHHPAQALNLLSEMQSRLGDLHDLSQRGELLRSGRRPCSKQVQKWVDEAATQAEARLPEELARYLSWQEKADFAGFLESIRE
jgi:CHAD domain-containing protein